MTTVENLSYKLSYLQLCKVDIGGVEGEADGEAELGVHQQGHLVLSLLHGSLLKIDFLNNKYVENNKLTNELLIKISNTS